MLFCFFEHKHFQFAVDRASCQLVFHVVKKKHMAQHEKKHGDQNKSKHYLNVNYRSDHRQYVMCKDTCKSLIHILYDTIYCIQSTEFEFTLVSADRSCHSCPDCRWRCNVEMFVLLLNPPGPELKYFNPSFLSESMRSAPCLSSQAPHGRGKATRRAREGAEVSEHGVV